MSFFAKYIRNPYTFQKTIVSLQTRKNNHPICISAKRTSSTISHSSIRKGSLTVEAALVLPIFMFAVIQLLSILDLYRFQVNLEAALHQSARQLAVYGYAREEIPAVSMLESDLGQLAFSESYVRGSVLSQLGESYLKQAPIAKTGVSFLESKILEDERIELVAVYRAQPYFSGITDGFFCSNRCVVRAFTGYDNTKGDTIQKEEEIVYITESGSVYHRDRSCSALCVSVSAVSDWEVKNRRNYDGSKYYACPYCGRKASGTVYITNYGNRYHGNITCSELKRSIMAVPLSEVGGRRACAKCGN